MPLQPGYLQFVLYLRQSMLHTLAGWLHEHALFLEIVLVILSAIVAFYADTIRHFFSLPPQRLHTWILKARLLSVNSKLFNLCECQNNAFSTLVYIFRALVVLFLITSLFIGGLFLEVVSIRLENRGDAGAYSRFHANLDISLALLFVVVVCSRLLLLGEFLFRLRNFKGYDQRLMERVTELEAKLGISDNAPANSLSE